MGHNQMKQYPHYGISQEEKDKGTESIFKAILDENFPVWGGQKWTFKSMQPKGPQIVES